MPSLADSLLRVKPYLPKALFSPKARAGIDELAQTLPFSYQAAFECRLAARAPQIDVSQIFTTQNGLRETLSANAQQHPDWPWLQSFCAQWSDQTSPLYEAISLVWVEHDLPPGGKIGAPPAVFIALREQNDPTNIDSVVRWLGQDAVLERVLDCIRLLPKTAIVYTLGLMPSRGIQGVRLPVHHLGKGEAVSYLGEIGWKGEIDKIARLLDRYYDLTDRIALDLDIGPEIMPHLGLELHLNAQPDKEPRWSKLLDQLVEDGLCSPEKREGLLAWPGLQVREAWPEHLLMEALLRGLDGYWLLARGLSHIKLVYAPGQALIAKAYFGFVIDWKSPSPLEVQRGEGLKP